MHRRIIIMAVLLTIITLQNDAGGYAAKSVAYTNVSSNKQITGNAKQESKDKVVDIKISFAGDCTLGTDEKGIPYKDSFTHVFKQVKGDYSYFFSKVKPVFSMDDLTLVNLEGTFTNAEKMARKKWRFKGDPSYVNILKAGGIEIVNVSNNHIHDFLLQGYKDTLKTLKNAGVAYSGEGHIEYIEKKGITIASLGYNGWDKSIKGRVYKDIKTAEKKAEIVIVSFHWGQEYTYYPNETQKELGRYSIDNGADVVIGHHPHVIQGIENYRGKYIVYSLGNFCFGGNPTPPEKDSIIFQNTFSFKNGSMYKSDREVLPCSVSTSKSVNNFQPVVLEGKEGQRVLARIYEYSSKLDFGIKK